MNKMYQGDDCEMNISEIESLIKNHYNNHGLENESLEEFTRRIGAPTAVLPDPRRADIDWLLAGIEP